MPSALSIIPLNFCPDGDIPATEDKHYLLCAARINGLNNKQINFYAVQTTFPGTRQTFT
jgi:hypothetical protein